MSFRQKQYAYFYLLFLLSYCCMFSHSPKPSVYEQVPVKKLAALMTICIASLVIAGWLFHIELLKRILPGLIAMNPVTAAAFILAAISIDLQLITPLVAPHNAFKQQVAKVVSLLILLIGFIKFTGFFTGWDGGIDTLLFGDRLAIGSIKPNRMAPNTALNFIGVGLALLMMHIDSEKYHRLAQTLVKLTAMSSLLAVVGYLYGIDAFYGFGPYTPMALHTALVFLVLCAGILYMRPDKGLIADIHSRHLGGTVARRLLPIAFLFPLALGWLGLEGQKMFHFSNEFGAGTIMVLLIFVFGLIILRLVSSLNRLEQEKWLAQAQLVQKEEFLQAITIACPDVVHVEDLVKGQNVYLNKEVGLSGYSSQELAQMGKRLTEEVVHPADVKIVLQSLRTIVKSRDGEVTVSEYRLKHKEGYYKWISDRIMVFRRDETGRVTQVLGWMQDITERKQAEERTHMLNNRVHSIMESAVSGLMAFRALRNAAGEIEDFEWLLVNQKVEEIVGYQPSELVGQRLLEKLPAARDKGIFDLYKKTVEKNVPLSFEYYLEKSQNWVQMNAVKLEDGLAVSFLDITGLKKIEAELILAREQAVQSMRAKSEFLSNMSHEIRTPMNAVIGFTNLLLEENPRPDQLEHLGVLEFASKNLLVLINDILDFSKIEAGKIVLEETEFNVKELVHRIGKTLQQRADEKRITLKLNLDTALVPGIVGDPVRLSQVLMNLVGNAIKFTEKGSVVMAVEQKCITSDEVMIYFSVTDTGIGIPEDKQASIFENFTQASSETTRKYGGTGLGLAITKRLLELQQSKIEVQSRVGEGSCFFFTLRFKKGHVQSSESPVLVAPAALKLLSGTRVLLVDDNPANILLAAKMMKKWDIASDSATNGRVAVGMAQQCRYDLILMDLQMPEMDGYEASLSIRALEDPYYKRVPIIALSASAMGDVIGRVTQSGMNDYLSKPFRAPELHALIARHVEIFRHQMGLS